MTSDAKVEEPAHVLDLSKQQCHTYSSYPVVAQVADKVCAAFGLYRGRPSSRGKETVDLVDRPVIQDDEAIGLRISLRAEASARSLLLPEELETHTRWRPSDRKLASRIPVCEDHRRVEATKVLMRQLVDAVPDDCMMIGVRNHAILSWKRSGQDRPQIWLERTGAVGSVLGKST